MLIYFLILWHNPNTPENPYEIEVLEQRRMTLNDADLGIENDLAGKLEDSPDIGFAIPQLSGEQPKATEVESEKPPELGIIPQTEEDTLATTVKKQQDIPERVPGHRYPNELNDQRISYRSC